MDRRSAIRSLAALGTLGLTGCTVTPTVRPSSTSPSSSARPVRTVPSDRLGGLRETLDALVTAARSGNRSAYDRCLSDVDPALPTRTSSWFDTIAALPWQQLSVTADGGSAPLSAARQDQLGDRAWLQGITLAWQLTGGASPPARQRLWWTVRDEGDAVRLVAVTDLPADTTAPPVPLWLQEPVRFAQQDTQAVLVAGGADADTWLGRAHRSASAVRRELPAPLGADWDSAVLLQVPSTRQGFERILGVGSGAYAEIAAAAWPMGPTARTAAVQVAVNPTVVAPLDRLGLEILLAHEATHVATHSPGSPAPTWLVEGLADHIAYSAYPQGRAAAAAQALRAVRDDGPPTALPTDEDFGRSGTELQLAYAWSWLACRYVAERWGETRLADLYAATDRGTGLTAAVPAVLGVDLAGLVRGWRTDLRQIAADPPW